MVKHGPVKIEERENEDNTVTIVQRLGLISGSWIWGKCLKRMASI